MNQSQMVQFAMEGPIAEWCTENGFGSDPVIVSTITGLATRLLDSVPYALSYDCLGSADRPETQQTTAGARETPAVLPGQVSFADTGPNPWARSVQATADAPAGSPETGGHVFPGRIG
jgi:hypothetical protein